METKFSVKLLSNLQVTNTMDKKTNKGVEKKTERVKDRGDLRKINNSKPNHEDIALKDFMPDRGDSQITNQKSISKPSIEKKKPEDSKKNSDLVKKDSNKKEETPIQIRTYLDLEGRKRLRERYTLKLKNSQNLSKNSDVKVETRENDNKNDKKADDEPTFKGNESSKDSVYTEPRTDKKPMKEAPPCSRRKPIIKTITVKNDNRVYKAVTFVDQKQHTPLQINIPNEYKKKAKDVNYKVKLKLSKESLKEKPVKRVTKRRKKSRVLSPELLMKGSASPPTEVAKWAPSCINHHTKPYYEAWVDTTLAAISKCSKNDKLYLEKQNIIQTFQRALLQRPNTPDLVYENYNDERYTGKIKVRQR